MKNLKTFILALRLRLRNPDDQDKDTPLLSPLVEFGFSSTPIKRLEQNTSHRSSNKIMNLFDAACRSRFGTGRYTLRLFTIFHISDYELVEFAEIFCTVVGQGYIFNGVGFSHQMAGGNTDSADDISEKGWEKFEQHLYKHVPVDGTILKITTRLSELAERNRKQIEINQKLIKERLERQREYKRVAAEHHRMFSTLREEDVVVDDIIQAVLYELREMNSQSS